MRAVRMLAAEKTINTDSGRFSLRLGLRPVVRLLAFVVLVAVPVAVDAGGRGEEQPEDAAGAAGESQVDYLGVAGVMIRDGNYERARAALEQVDLTREDVDLAQFYTLSGLLSLRDGNYPQATSSFSDAIDNGQDDPIIYVYLAQGLYFQKRYREAVDAIDRVPSINQFPDLYAIKAEALWNMRETAEAYETISSAVELFPSRTQFAEQRIFYLIDLDLTQQAAEESVRYLDRVRNDPSAYITIGQALRRGGQLDQAIVTLESARLLFPEDSQVKLSLAQAYLDDEKPRTAGRLVEEAAALNFELYHDAAEIYRRAGDLDRALYLNSQVPDEEKKTRQRFNLLLAMNRYEEALALEGRLDRLGILDGDETRYAIAYAFFQTRQLDRSVEYLNRISSSEFFSRATQLRRAIETVRSSDTELL
mgnify:CR=1 FL=1